MELVVKDLPGVLHSPHHIHHVDWEANGPAVVAEPSGYGLADPPGRIGGELEALAPSAIARMSFMRSDWSKFPSSMTDFALLPLSMARAR